MSYPFALSFSYRSAPSELRSRLASNRPEIELALEQLGLDAWMVLATCNRFEVWGDAGSNALPQALLAGIGPAAAVPYAELAGCCSFAAGSAAVRHAFAVSAGLDSLLLGESEILGQIRAAYDEARAAGHCYGALSLLVQHALHVGKKVRSETSISRGRVTLPGCALEVARRELGTLDTQTVLIVGAGKMGRKAARSLETARIGRIIIANRTPEHAAEVASRCGGEAIGLAGLPAALTAADVVITATAASQPVITLLDLQRAARERPARRILVDLAVPYDIVPEVTSIAGVQLLHPEDLRAIVDEHLAERERARQPAGDMVDQEVERYLRALHGEIAGPTIRELLRRAEEIRRGEIARLGRGADATQVAALERLSRSLVKALLHEPIVQTRVLSEQPEVLPLVRKLFALDEMSASA